MSSSQIDYRIRTESSLANEVEKLTRALRVSELAEILSTSKMTIYRLVKQGAIPHLRVRGLIRFDPRATGDWLRGKTSSSRPAS